MKILFITAATLAATTSTVFASDLATTAEINTAISGNSIQGSMLVDSYSEHYMADGTIKADGYTGTWSTKDNKMCFQYGTDPEDCWSASIEGPAIIWYKDGVVNGTGTVITGNPNKF